MSRLAIPKADRGTLSHYSVSAANRRITKEYAELQQDWPPYVVAQPDESNLLHWVSFGFRLSGEESCLTRSEIDTVRVRVHVRVCESRLVRSPDRRLHLTKVSLWDTTRDTEE